VPADHIRSGPEQFDIDAREAQVLGTGQRIAALGPEEFTPEAEELARQIGAVFGTKVEGIPEMFATLLKHPAIYRSQLDYGAELTRAGALPPRERELVILRVGWLCRAPFEWGEHVDAGKRHGLTDAEIARVREGSDSPGWGEHDRALIRAVEELIGDYVISDETWAVLARNWTDTQLIELPGLVGAYTATAMLYNTLRFQLLPGNTGLRHS
jgi:4-carboxymuconolactone decarboxylase